jgi:hypothetical protein
MKTKSDFSPIDYLTEAIDKQVILLKAISDMVIDHEKRLGKLEGKIISLPIEKINLK